MALNIIPRYSNVVALTEQDGTWYVVTVQDTVGYPTYRDAYQGYLLTIEALNARVNATREGSSSDYISERYAAIEAPFDANEIRLARLAVGRDNLAGIGYESDYRAALRVEAVALASIRTGA